ncbi:MAG: cytochrome-c oxidase [Planctomycetes bacterium]|nr:cytochrome-c oxidase [Planctomycetota bacterium]
MDDRSPSPLSLAFPLALVILAAAVVGTFFLLDWRLDVASEHGRGVDQMIFFLLVCTGPLFVAGHLAVAWFVWKSRWRDTPAYLPPSPRAEWLATLIPVLLIGAVAEGGVLAIGMPVWGQVYREEPDTLPVEIVGKQFEWIARYPGRDGKFGRTEPTLIDDVENPLGLDEDDPAATDDIVVRGALYLPSGRAASIRIRSLDVLHSFAVPVMRTKQDAVPGLVTRTQMRPTTPGKYEITCAELCGMGHYRMRGYVNVLTPEEFEAWRARQVGWFE